jgi:type IV pilus assembly protein PilY1
MIQTARIPQYRRWLAGVLAVILGLGPLATPSYAALTLLADQPLSAQSQAKPNIVLTVDDSTSMLFDYLPDSVIGTFCRGMTGAMSANCGTPGNNTVGKYVSAGHTFQQFGLPFSAMNPAFDPSGPGAGCAGANCSPGIDPAPTPVVLAPWTLYPGIERYPKGTSPKAGQPYEYWTLWPAPAHNSEFNHVYYNPRQQYDPPIDALGNPYPQMDSGTTSNWTHVPADPWAEPWSDPWTPWPPQTRFIDLTAPVTVGLWCNSDWSIGNESNPAYCRTNGTGADALTSSTSSALGDYNYPWAPPGIDPAGPVALGTPTIAKSIAYSKVDGAGNLKTAWTDTPGAKDAKYFYENDNILWCDPTSSLWPQTGPTTDQTCVGGSNVPQQCIGRVDQTCTTGTPQTCVGATSDSCNGAQTQTCGPLAHQTCTNATSQTCNPPSPQHCDGVGTQTCDGVTSQTCDNTTPQTCDNVTGGTCAGVTHQVCNLVTPTCNPTTCAETWEYQDPVTLAWVADPTNQYCPCDGDECRACRIASCPKQCSSNSSVSCVDASTCPVTGACSGDHNSCTATTEAQCPTQSGTCVGEIPAISCLADGVCPSAGHCSNQILTVCHHAGVDPACTTLPGHCSGDGNTCTTPGVTAECPNAGHCSIVNTASCHSAGVDLAECPTQNGFCFDGVTHTTACFADHPDCDRSSACSVTGLTCTTTCPDVGGTCSIDGLACTTGCGDASHCSLDTGIACHVTGYDPAECPDHPGTCLLAIPTKSCNGPGDCLPLPDGHCSSSGLPCSTTCPTLDQKCSVTGEACSSTAYTPACTLIYTSTTFVDTFCSEPSYCPIQNGVCSVDGNPCPYTAQAGFFYNPITGAFWGYLFGPPYNYFWDASICDNALTEGHCSIDTGTKCYSSGADPVCAPHAGPAGSASCSDMRSDNLKSLLEDANGPGLVCRHNNQLVGAAYTSGPYDYPAIAGPNTRFNTPVTGGTGPNACVASPRYATVPRHYWKTGLEWCDGAITTAGDKWLGYGKRAVDSSCQDAQDTTHIYPRFYQFGQPSTTDNDPTPAFRRTDLIPGATYTHDWTDDNGPEEIIRSFADEMTNYANWFAYYRTRIQAVKTVTSASFTEIDAKYRVGFHAMFSLPSFLNIADFDSTVQKPAWFSKLFGVAINLGQETPTLTAMARIGDYFLNGTHPQLSRSSDPITLSCQQNFHMLFTDGFTNQDVLPGTQPGNVDAIVPAGPVLGAFPIGLAANPIIGITQGSAWPRPYREDPGQAMPTLNALSDYAMAYWVTNLRPGPTLACPLCGVGAANVPTSNIPPLAGDRYSAKWQHLNFAALSLGTSGKLPAADQVAVEANLRNPAGSLQWPQPKDSLGMPNVLKPDNSGVDDLWHAAMNGHGDFVNADSIDEVKLGIGKILAGVGNLPGTATGVGAVSSTFGASANFIYRVRFEQSWAGSLAKIQIDPTTGLPLVIPPIWNASDQLTAATAPVDGWRTGRRIVTMNESGTAVPFLWGSLGPHQQDSLAPGKPAARTQLILQFLRGDRSKEGEKVGNLRVRTSPMGDIVDSSPVYVGAPNLPYLDASDAGYSGFKSTFSARPPRIYVGANDGMLHAFDDANGNETWAYVPTPLFRDGSAAVGLACQAANTAVPCGTAGGDPKTGLGALAFQDGALPAFRHHFYVDSTPKIVDVDFNAPAGTGWRTLLVGGLGKGGNRYYALNVTDPAAVTDEASAANQILWEFPAVANTTIDMGYTYGKPVIAKTRTLFGGAWLVAVGSGYDNPSGVGKLYFLQASNPNPNNFKVMSTGVGSPSAPAGLAHPAGYTQDFHNQLAEQLYVGDLLGDFWRFDVSSPVSDTAWTFGQLANLIPPGGGSQQPVTTPPEIKIDVSNGIDRWVFVGTGKLYDQSDLADTQQQTMYAFRDGTASAPLALPATPIDRTTTGCTPDPCLVPLPATDPTNNFGLATAPSNGWYHDLPNGGRIVVAPQAAFGVIAYISTRPPSSDLCAIGLPVTLYAREYGTGQSLLTSHYDDGTGTVVPGIDIESGGVGLQIVAFQPADTATSTLPDVRLAITLPDGSVRYFKPKLPSLFFQHRMSWRLLGQ